MLNVRRGLDCYEQELQLRKPTGFLSTHSIQNHPNDVFIHRYKMKLCNVNQEIVNPNFENGNLGAIAQTLAIEKALLAYVGFYSVATRGEITDKTLDKAKLFNMRSELTHGFDRYAEDLNRALVWYVQGDWYKNSQSLIILHNFLNAIMIKVGGFKNDRDPLSPIRNTDFISLWLLRMNGDYETEQFRLLTELKKLITQSLRRFMPHIFETYYTYKVTSTNRGLFVEIDVLSCFKFDNMDSVIFNLLNTRKDTYFSKLFPLNYPIGADLAAFCPLLRSVDMTFQQKLHPLSLLKNERKKYFMSIENQLKRAEEDQFSSSDDENFLSPTRAINAEAISPTPNQAPRLVLPKVQSSPKMEAAKNDQGVFITPNRPVRKRRRPQ